MTADADATGGGEERIHQNLQKDARGDDIDADAEHEVDDLTDSKPKKKRRVVNKSPDKKYECPHPECGKTYSRAEHLYRHQLNHTPKQIYRCDFPGCDRSFVRADLCARHKERHTAKGSHLQRKDAFLQSQRSTGTASGGSSPSGSITLSNTSPIPGNLAYQSTSDPYMSAPVPAQPYTPVSDHSQSASMTDLTPLRPNGLHVESQPGSYSAYPGNVHAQQYPAMPLSAPADDRRFTYDGTYPARPPSQVNSFNQYQAMPMTTMQPPPMSSPQSAGPMYSQQAYPSPASSNQNFRSSSNFSMPSSYPGFGYLPSYTTPRSSAQSGVVSTPANLSSIDHQAVPSSGSNSIIDFNVFDQMVTGNALPVFGSETPFIRSPPPPLDENFLNLLLNTTGMELNDPPSSEPDPEQPMPDLSAPLPKVEPDGTTADRYPSSLSSTLDISMRESTISEAKQQRLVELVQNLGEIENSPGRWSKAEILAGNPKDPSHVMSVRMLKTYTTSYWMYIHHQMPILHRPTFNPETCPDLLLLAMMCFGAICLERTHTLELTQRSAELAFFVADHIRWEIFRDADFRPTAKLWTFQTMLLLELFEKMFSTRALHERGHIHHATTLTVMRRGSSLIGRSALETPSRSDDPTRTPPGPEGTINASGQNTTDAYWNRWITAEATRRSAFAAFIVDSTHATLFGHSAVMSPHELRLPLPCDEALWSATSSAEVQRVEASLSANGFKTPSFLDALRRTLNGQKVRTNAFGRMILMAGLLNVSWHMNQRDVQVSSLGAGGTLGNQMKWRSALTRAFDNWRRDFDESLSKNDHYLQACKPTASEPCPLDHRETVFETRTCLHSLAHMAMHVDMIDCQVFAGVTWVLGRQVTESDHASVQRRMRDQWAPSARARDAVFYALRFLCEVLIPEEELAAKRPNPHQPPTFNYSARDDYLLNRPWVLYFAALIVWSYGYALDGPIKPSTYTLTTRELQIHDMQRYLIRMGGVASPDDLENQKDRNFCLGLLLLLREKFQQPQWQLMHDAGDALGSCIDLLLPKKGSEGRQGAAG